MMQWPGREPFVFGTAFHEDRDSLAQVEEALRAKFYNKMGKILPLGTPQPTILRFMPGAIFFVKEGEF